MSMGYGEGKGGKKAAESIAANWVVWLDHEPTSLNAPDIAVAIVTALAMKVDVVVTLASEQYLSRDALR